MDEFVDYNIAKQLRDIGFDEDCLGFYELDKTVSIVWEDFDSRTKTPYASTYYQVFQWFRNVHKLHSSIAWVTKGYDFYVKKEPSRIINETTHVYSDYRECEIACIEYMINLVKNETSTG